MVKEFASLRDNKIKSLIGTIPGMERFLVTWIGGHVKDHLSTIIIIAKQKLVEILFLICFT